MQRKGEKMANFNSSLILKEMVFDKIEFERKGFKSNKELEFNTLDEHFSDEHVRRALAMAIDRESLTKALTFGYAEIANTVLPRALLYQTNDTVNALSYDIDAS